MSVTLVLVDAPSKRAIEWRAKMVVALIVACFAVEMLVGKNIVKLAPAMTTL